MFKKLGLMIITAAFLTACTSTPKEIIKPTLDETLNDPRVIAFPLKTTTHGRWVITINIDEDYTADMVLDTGATYSAFFENSISKLGLSVDAQKITRIHGLVTNADAANTNVSTLRLGHDVYNNKDFAVLPVASDDPAAQNPNDGVIGMDILKHYRIFVDSSESQIYFIPNIVNGFELPARMKKIDLFANPYTDVAPNLHFLNISIQKKDTPALLDTGTDINVINWHSANFVQARAMRARLKWKWEVAGAVGKFEPTVRAEISSLKSGQHEWRAVNMIIKDTDSLKILGVDEQPFIIAGIGLLDNRDVYLDFENDKLWLNHNETNTDPSNVVSLCVKC